MDNSEKPKKRKRVKKYELAYTTTPTGQLSPDGKVYDKPEGRKYVQVK